MCWKDRPDPGIATALRVPVPSQGGAGTERLRGAHLLGATEAWNEEKTLECSVCGLEMAARTEDPGRMVVGLRLPAASAVTESLPGSLGTLLASALLLPFVWLPWGAAARSRGRGGGWEQLKEDGVTRALGTAAALG